MIPLTRPTLPKLESMHSKMQDVFKTSMLTNGKYVKEFEGNCAKFLGAKNVVAVSNGTSAIMLALKCLDLKGEIIISSFTFTSGGHAPLWCGLKPVFADINKETFNIDPGQIEKKITKKTSAILATHVFGNPCQIDEIQKIAKKHNLKVIYDAAHAFGSKYKNKPVAQFGDVSIFSLTPTKVLTTGEGGLAITNDKKLADKLTSGRNNGDNFDREKEFLGLTARMPELNAILGIEGLKMVSGTIKRRLKMVDLYKKELSGIAGISFQKIDKNSYSVYKDMVVLIDREKFGISRDKVLDTLKKNNIESKVYFYPSLHKKAVYGEYKNTSLPVTDFIGSQILSLPLYSHMPEAYVKKVCVVIKSLYKKI